jgi:hypothetical protein
MLTRSSRISAVSRSNASPPIDIGEGRTLIVLRAADGTPKWKVTGDATDGCGVNHAALAANTER